MALQIYENVFQGKRHQVQGKPCQDRCGYCVTRNGWTVCMAADGVSASPMAEIGAQIAIESCREYFSLFRFSPFLTQDRMQMILYDAFNYALRRIHDNDSDKIPYARYTTLQLVVFGPRIGLHWGIAGDGAIILRDQDGRWTYVGKRLKHEEDENSPVTIQDGPDFWQFGSLAADRLDGIMITTDGVADSLENASEIPEIKEEMMRLLMCPPNADAETVKRYYEDLFFETEKPSRKIGESNEARAYLRTITDDITVFLVCGLAGDSSMRAAKPVRESTPLAGEHSIRQSLPSGNVKPEGRMKQEETDQAKRVKSKVNRRNLDNQTKELIHKRFLHKLLKALKKS